MNLLEHHIEKIISVKDVTKDITNTFKDEIGYEPQEPLLQVEVECNCYGVIEHKTLKFWESEFKEIKKKGYFLA